jgi:hypothetical protein
MKGGEQMATYIVTTTSVSAYDYTIRANSKEEAEEKFDEGNWLKCEENTTITLDNDEEIIKVLKMKE